MTDASDSLQAPQTSSDQGTRRSDLSTKRLDVEYHDCMRWCAKCGTPIDDGLLLCADCAPRHSLIQDVKIMPGKGSTAKAYKTSTQGSRNQSRLRVVEKVEWIHDRQRNERIVRLFDKENNSYSETCFDLETGEITWGPKYEDLDRKPHRSPNDRKE